MTASYHEGRKCRQLSDFFIVDEESDDYVEIPA
jgi:hypothetical protein